MVGHSRGLPIPRVAKPGRQPYTRSVEKRVDYVLVGGGLQNGLIALALLDRSPQVKVVLVEREPTLGGNHTWCFHSCDVPARARSWMDPLVVASWPEYEVRFPELRRLVHQPYEAITSERFAEVVSRQLASAPGCAVVTGVAAANVAAGRVVLEDGRAFAGWVVDARGPDPVATLDGAGFQKFVGLEVELTSPARITRPVVMEARVPQLDGYRFLYILPFAPDRMLVEDTYFSDDPRLDSSLVRRRIHDYLASCGLEPSRVVREEAGVLPMPWRGPIPAPVSEPFVAGVRGGWFHPGTGYSLPVAARVADLFARHAPEPPPARELAALRHRVHRQARFARFLNWMLFRAVEPDQRWRILQRFYRLPEETIARFYALETTACDRARVVVGRPPRGLRIPLP